MLFIFVSCSTADKDEKPGKGQIQKTTENELENDTLYDFEQPIDSLKDKTQDNLGGVKSYDGSELTAFYSEDSILNIEVSNVNDLFKNIASNTRLILEPGDYYLDEIDKSLSNDNCNWAMVLFDEIAYDESYEDDATLLLMNLENFFIQAKHPEQRTQVLTRKLTASVMAFEKCNNLHISGLFFGHENETLSNPHNAWVSYCSGEVLEFFDSENIELDDLDLFGCGTRGFLAHRCENFSIGRSIIHDCTYGAFGLFNCRDTKISDLDIANNRIREVIEIEACWKTTMENIRFLNNVRADEYASSGYQIDSSIITGKDWFFENNYFASEELLNYLKSE
jgi:hypothetical protein